MDELVLLKNNNILCNKVYKFNLQSLPNTFTGVWKGRSNWIAAIGIIHKNRVSRLIIKLDTLLLFIGIFMIGKIRREMKDAPSKQS